MHKIASLTMAVLVFFGLVLAFGVTFAPHDTQAATVIGHQHVIALDGTTRYTTTTYTNAYLAGAFGNVVIQAHDDISSTGTMTVTPQFSSEAVCRTASHWVAAETAFIYAKSNVTPTLSSVALNFVVTNDGARLFELPVSGNCLRLKLEASKPFTPTVYLRMVNTQ
ncbi:MAG TPA: hypothetical protein PKH77_05185 [Anaerolineae bacterium]|nr:hypothetical protein [Anaerolineae bacterium]